MASNNSNTGGFTYPDEYFREKASTFKVEQQKLQGLSWEQVGENAGLKHWLKATYTTMSRQFSQRQIIPPGILLHGPQGTGKSCIVKSFAAQYEMTVFKVDGSILEPLEGHSEKLLKFVFEAIRTEALEKPCILLFEHVDGILADTSSSYMTLQLILKSCWRDLIEDRVRCFVFGTTNLPWKIDMEVYGDCFHHRYHISKRDSINREHALKHSLSKIWHTIDRRGLQDVAVFTQDLSAADINAEIGGLNVKLCGAKGRATSWVEMVKNGKKVTVPALQSEAGFTARLADIKEPHQRPLSLEMAIQHFKHGKIAKTVSPESEKAHEEWAARWT